MGRRVIERRRVGLLPTDARRLGIDRLDDTAPLLELTLAVDWRNRLVSELVEQVLHFGALVSHVSPRKPLVARSSSRVRRPRTRRDCAADTVTPVRTAIS